ncbi:hypothetical protein ACLKA7_007761 [Drosophila subpalustris]
MFLQSQHYRSRFMAWLTPQCERFAHAATFVSNRVAEIQEWTENAEWRHVPTKQNPADIVSRGCDVNELVTSIWFNGPSFLKEPRDSWPVSQHLVTDEMRTLEVRKTAVGLTAMVDRPDLFGNHR